MGSSNVDMVIEGVELALNMAEDAQATQEYITGYCRGSKNIKMAVAQAINEQIRRIEDICNILRKLKNVRAQEVRRLTKEKEKAFSQAVSTIRANKKKVSVFTQTVKVPSIPVSTQTQEPERSKTVVIVKDTTTVGVQTMVEYPTPMEMPTLATPSVQKTVETQMTGGESGSDCAMEVETLRYAKHKVRTPPEENTLKKTKKSVDSVPRETRQGVRRVLDQETGEGTSKQEGEIEPLAPTGEKARIPGEHAWNKVGKVGKIAKPDKKMGGKKSTVTTTEGETTDQEEIKEDKKDEGPSVKKVRAPRFKTEAILVKCEPEKKQTYAELFQKIAEAAQGKLVGLKTVRKARTGDLLIEMTEKADGLLRSSSKSLETRNASVCYNKG